MKLLMTIIFVLVGIGIGFVVNPPSSLRVREVILTSNPEQLTEQDLVRLAGIEKGENLLLLSLRQVREKIMRYSWVKDVRLARSFPGRVQISIEEQEPIALLELDSFYLLNQDGIIFREVSADDPKDFPLITGLSRDDFSRGGPGRARLESLLDILRSASAMPAFKQLGISELKWSPEGISLFTLSPVTQLYLGRTRYKEGLARFGVAAEAIFETASRPKFIDLSFEERIFVKRKI